MDPVYLAVTIGYNLSQMSLHTDPAAVTLDDIALSQLQVTIYRGTKTPASVIKDKIRAILENYFNPSILTLGYTVNVPDITSEILAIPGVKSVETVNDGAAAKGVSFIVYNPSYPDCDVRVKTDTFTAEDFQAIYLDNIDDIVSRIVIIPEVSQDTSIINF
jgi:hypothetical protein